MKKYIFVLFVLAIQNSQAAGVKDTISRFTFQRMLLPVDDCDACGCSANGGSMGFSSMLNNNFVGLRYVNQSYTTKEGIFKNSPWIDENFNTVQVWARVPITERIQITALLPYHDNNRTINSENQSIKGIGDFTIIGMYTIFQTHKDSLTYTHKIQLGAGVKAPTGKYNTSNNGTLNPSFQLGTGSWDYLLVSEYIIKRKQLGLNTSLSYTIKTENAKHYQFGNQFNYGGTLFYLLDLDAIKLVPQIGVAGEVYQSNQQFQQDVIGTKGDVVFSKFGFELGKENFSIGMNAMLPINQNLTAGNVKANHRFSINLNYRL